MGCCGAFDFFLGVIDVFWVLSKRTPLSCHDRLVERLVGFKKRQDQADLGAAFTSFNLQGSRET